MSLSINMDNQGLVFRAALLAGMGRQAQSIATAALPDTPPSTAAEQGKTCIDDGGRILFSLHSARPNELGVIRRMAGGTAGIQPWLRTHYRRTSDGIQVDTWQSCIFTGESQAQFTHVLHTVQESGDACRLRQIHAELGRCGRFIFAMRPTKPGCLPAWIGWKLDKHMHPSTALTALGWGALWPQARTLMQQFLGTPLTDHSRPWSIAVGFGAGRLLVRIGSTIWARQLEDRGKRRRLVNCMKDIGGDGRTAEALYKLLLPTSDEPLTRVGRAIEIEFHNGQFQGVDVLLAGGP
jgi:hypothetical protein